MKYFLRILPFVLLFVSCEEKKKEPKNDEVVIFDAKPVKKFEGASFYASFDGASNEGDYLLSVNGAEVYANQNLYSFFENTADKIVELKVGPNADGTASRKVKVVPVGNEYSLRNY